MSSCISYRKRVVPSNCVILSHGVGNAKRARRIAEVLNCNLAFIDPKKYLTLGDTKGIDQMELKDIEIIGKVKSYAVIVCDLVDTARTIVRSAEVLKSQGAKYILTIASHGTYECERTIAMSEYLLVSSHRLCCFHPFTAGVLSQDAIERLNNSPIDELVTSDSLPIHHLEQSCKKLKLLTIANFLGEAMRRIHNEESLSSLHKMSGKSGNPR